MMLNQFVQTLDWSLEQAEIGNPSAVPSASGLVIASVQVAGTFGDATVKIEISNDGMNFVPANGTDGNELSITSATIRDISTAAAYVRAKTTGGDGTTALTVRIAVWG